MSRNSIKQQLWFQSTIEIALHLAKMFELFNNYTITCEYTIFKIVPN